jgi:hypothetical protein
MADALPWSLAPAPSACTAMIMPPIPLSWTKSNSAEKQVSCLPVPPLAAKGATAGRIPPRRSARFGLTTLGHIGPVPVKIDAAQARVNAARSLYASDGRAIASAHLPGPAHERPVRFSPVRGIRAGLASTLQELMARARALASLHCGHLRRPVAVDRCNSKDLARPMIDSDHRCT